MKRFFYFIFSKLPQYYAKLQLNWLDIEGLRLLGCNCWIMEQRRMAVFIGKSGFTVHVPANMRKNVGDRGADRHIVGSIQKFDTWESFVVDSRRSHSQ